MKLSPVVLVLLVALSSAFADTGSMETEATGFVAVRQQLELAQNNDADREAILAEAKIQIEQGISNAGQDA